MKKLILLFLFSIVSFQSHAGPILDLTYFTFTDSMTYASSYSSAKTLMNIAFYFDISRSGGNKFGVGWDMTTVSVTDSISAASVDQKFSASDMGPCFRWNIDSKKLYSLNFAYLLSSTTKFTNSGSEATWTGVPMLIRFNIEPEISESLHLGFSLNYYKGAYSKSLVSTTQSTVSYSRTFMFPTLSLAYYF